MPSHLVFADRMDVPSNPCKRRSVAGHLTDANQALKWHTLGITDARSRLQPQKTQDSFRQEITS